MGKIIPDNNILGVWATDNGDSDINISSKIISSGNYENILVNWITPTSFISKFTNKYINFLVKEDNFIVLHTYKLNNYLCPKLQIYFRKEDSIEYIKYKEKNKEIILKLENDNKIFENEIIKFKEINLKLENDIIKIKENNLKLENDNKELKNNNKFKIIFIKGFNDMTLSYSSGYKKLDNSRKYAVWDNNDKIKMILKTDSNNNNYLYDFCNNKYLSWSSGYDTLSDNKKWATWSPMMDNPIKIENDLSNNKTYLKGPDDRYLSWNSGFQELSDNRKWAIWSFDKDTSISINEYNFD